MTTHGLLFLRIVTGFPVLFTSAVTREKLFFASASPIVSVDILPLSTLAIIVARVWPQIKANAAAVYARWGISLSDAINIFLAKSIEVGGLPFDMRPETPTFDGLERYAYRPTMDSNGVAQLPRDWDDGE